jgi:hypothetical protein
MKTTRKKPDWSVFDRARIKERAYHEAGHAVVEFLLGRAQSHLVHISMRGNDERAAYVRRERCIEAAFLLHAAVPANQRPAFRSTAIREGIFCLAGPAAEWKSTGDVDFHWFDQLCESAEWDGDDDFMHPLLFAKKVTKTEGHAWLLLRHMARWTDELLAVPRVWKTVESLADSLRHGDEMPGKAACAVMENAWGDDAGLPLFALGRQWRRRMLEVRSSRTPKSSAKIFRGPPWQSDREER